MPAPYAEDLERSLNSAGVETYNTVCHTDVVGSLNPLGAEIKSWSGLGRPPFPVPPSWGAPERDITPVKPPRQLPPLRRGAATTLGSHTVVGGVFLLPIGFRFYHIPEGVPRSAPLKALTFGNITLVILHFRPVKGRVA